MTAGRARMAELFAGVRTLRTEVDPAVNGGRVWWLGGSRGGAVGGAEVRSAFDGVCDLMESCARKLLTKDCLSNLKIVRRIWLCSRFGFVILSLSRSNSLFWFLPLSVNKLKTTDYW